MKSKIELEAESIAFWDWYKERYKTDKRQYRKSYYIDDLKEAFLAGNKR